MVDISNVLETWAADKGLPCTIERVPDSYAAQATKKDMRCVITIDGLPFHISIDYSVSVSVCVGHVRNKLHHFVYEQLDLDPADPAFFTQCESAIKRRIKQKDSDCVTCSFDDWVPYYTNPWLLKMAIKYPSGSPLAKITKMQEIYALHKDVIDSWRIESNHYEPEWFEKHLLIAYQGYLAL